MAISNELANKLIQDSLNSLHKSGLIEQAIVIQDDTVLLGTGTVLDSLSFVTFITELEDRLSQASGTEIYLVLQDVNEFNTDNPYSTVGTLSRHLVNITKNIGDFG